LDKSKSKKLLVTASHFEEALREVREKEGFPHVESS
jgi:hypothetical protein